MKAPVLESNRLLYRPISRLHLSDDYVSWLNDPDVYRYLETGGNYTRPVLEKFLLEAEKKEILFWAIHLKTDDLHIGNIKIDPIHEKHSVGEYGIMMGRKTEWGKGYAKEATETIVQFCFNTINLRKMTLGVVADNVAAVKLYENLDFAVEGHYKKHGFYDGKYCDVLRMARFNPIFSYNEK
jgi:RimJ/RimL family protein N-acetyltransferase